ncbi:MULTISPECIES: PP2C family protein-serine/threonine phosphatase [Polymorphospora]|uniref:PP2C family protein-serine/threonine phosphatase n=1 Tax=Polymorphospora lycopeni TaxID=3140240 RepID=A0ABV5D205_9ACTN
MPESRGSVAALLRAAAPDELVEVADGFIRTRLGGARTDVLVADYRISGLWPVLGESHPAHGPLAETSAAVRCFGSQRSVVEQLAAGGVRLHLPVTAWGERIGVLVTDFAATPDGELVDEVGLVADELAVALRAADRDTDRYRRARRRERLTMAAEMQWDLLPGRGQTHPAYRLAGQLEPAYTVGGDHFDWALTDDRLTVTVLNGYGAGLAASLLTAVTVNAMRNARRSGGSLVEQAELASDTVFAEHRGTRHVATLLVEVDLPTGRVRVVDAGSPRALLMRGQQVELLRLDQQLPLGMFADTRYEAQEFKLEPDDRLVVVSDGVYTAAPGGRAPYGESALARAIRRTRLQPATEAVGTVMRELRAYHEHADLEDDAVIVCLDWDGMKLDTAGSGVRRIEPDRTG